MREVLFKAKRLDGEWVEGSLIVYPIKQQKSFSIWAALRKWAKHLSAPKPSASTPE